LTIYHLIFVAAILGGGYLLNYYVRRKRIQTAHAAMTPAPLPPVQIAVGVPVEHLPNPYPPYRGTMRINDPLRDNTAGYGWMDESIKQTVETEGCHFCEDAYHLTISSKQQSYMVYCLATRTNFSDFVYQIEATLLKGTEIGVVFRQTPGFCFYYFYIRRDGTYGLQWNAGRSMQFHLLKDGMSSAINIGLHQPNVLAVVANGNMIDLYVNQQHLTSVTDNTYRAGRIATAAATDARSPSEAAFSNLLLWTLDEVG
jgi:hypothetical protein